MENKLFEDLDDLNIKDTNSILSKDIKLSLDDITIKRIEKLVKKKTGYYNSSNMFKQKINYIFGGIYMKRKIALILSVIAVSSLGGGVYAHAKTTPVAYVSMDINPSVELGVNTFDEVVSAEAYNEDGEKVLEGTNLVNSKVDEAVKAVITNAVSDGYIKEDDTVTNDAADQTATTSAAVEITTSTDKDGLADKLNESLKEAADKALKDNNTDATVETDKVALARRDEARQLGMTPGKLNLIQKLQALDSTINVEDYKSSSVKDIQKKFKELKKDNKSNDTTNISASTNTDTNTGTNTSSNTDTNANADVVTQESTDNSSNGNGAAKKEEHSNSNNKKEDNDSTNDKEKDTVGKSEKQNNSSNSNSQSKGNSVEKNKNN